MKRDYYIFNGDSIKREDNTIRLIYEDGSFKDLPVEKVESIHIMNEMSFNTKWINFVNQHEITVHFYNYYGYYTGSFYPKDGRVSGELLVRQVNASQNQQMRVEIAKSLLEGASYNIHRNLRYYKERDKEVELTEIEMLEKRLLQCKEIDELMGVEGNLRKHYYSNWDAILGEVFTFDKRTRMPPENPVNVLISFINTLFYTTCISEIYKTHLNPTISFLHEPGTSRFSLALDISEVFKPLIVDRLIFTLINKRMLNEKSFIKDSNGLFLEEDARRLIVKAYDERLATTILHNQLNRNVSYRQLVRLELLKLEKLLLLGEAYSPFKLSW